VSDESVHGRVVATRRAVIDLVRAATLASYGVSDFAGGPLERVLARIAGRPPGLRVSLARGEIALDLRLRVSPRLPIAEVARQVESAIRYAIRRSLDREVTRLTIRIAGLESPAMGTTGPGPRTSGEPPEETAVEAAPIAEPAPGDGA
jgi:uncharacterized alkaline shock family protein YloU